jgi:hypothetical protein
MAICVVTVVVRLAYAPRQRIWIVFYNIAFLGLDAHGEGCVASWGTAYGIAIGVGVHGLEVREPAHPGGERSTTAMPVWSS